MPTVTPIYGIEAHLTNGALVSTSSAAALATQSVETERLGTDVELPEDPDAPLRVTPTGDLVLLTGRPNLAAALRRRFKVVPGSLVHRPTYGVGALLYLEGLGTPSNKAALSNSTRRNILADNRLADAQVGVSTGRPNDPSRTASVKVQINARLAGVSAGDPPMSVAFTSDL